MRVAERETGAAASSVLPHLQHDDRHQANHPAGGTSRCQAPLARARFWPGIVAVILITIVLLPPAAGYARQYAFAQALQFVIFAVVGPALLARGRP